MRNWKARTPRALPYVFNAAAACVAAAVLTTAGHAQGRRAPSPAAAAPAPQSQAPASPQVPVPQPPAASAQPPAAAASDLPSARSILDRHVEAIGGRKAILARGSSHGIGTMSMPSNGMTAAVEAFAAKPNRILVRFKIEGIGEVVEGFDGTIGWSINPMTGPMLTQGKELEQKKFDADFYADLYAAGRYKTITTVERTLFDGRPCYKVSLLRHDGIEDFEFFDVDTGLKAGRVIKRETPMGTMEATQIVSDYRRFGDLLQPTTMKQTMMGVEQIFTTTRIDYDTVDPAVFVPPPAIKALIK